MLEKTLTVTKEDAVSIPEIAADGFDHIEFYVGNALQACYYYQSWVRVRHHRF